MRICIVGAGAVGGYIASLLAFSEAADTSVLARGVTLAALHRHSLDHDGPHSGGLRVQTNDGVVTVAVRAAGSAAELGQQDVIVLAVKAQAAPAAVGAIRPLLGPSTVVLPAMNGVPWWFFDRVDGSTVDGSTAGDGGSAHEDTGDGDFGGPCAGMHLSSVDPGGAMARAIPVSRVLGVVVHFSASSPAPGVVRHFSGDRLIIGEPSGAASARLATVTKVLREAGFTVDVSDRIRQDAWYKLWGNLTINPVSALTGATSGQILDDSLVRGFCESAMLEAREIGARIGCPIEELPADRNLVTRKLGDFRTSMLQDALAGRALELDALTGAVREIGAVVGVPTPYVDALHGLSRLAEQVRLRSAEAS
jgi:2-dehydropantoate 2-reductase